MANAINWFEIPATNFQRAKQFYAQIFDQDLPVQEIMGNQMAFFHTETGDVGGAICCGEGYVPSKEGTLPYLNGGNDLDSVLDRVEDAGGRIVLPKTKISDEIGYFGLFLDTEGNKLALHSPN